jgi:hypothetical protein
MAESEPGGGTGEEEQQRHVPGTKVLDEVGKAFAERCALGVEVVADVEDAGHVEGEQQQYGDDAQPVDVVAAGVDLGVHDKPLS